MGGHVLRETTSRGLCGLVCPSRTSERGGEGDCVKEGGEEEGKCERERALRGTAHGCPERRGCTQLAPGSPGWNLHAQGSQIKLSHFNAVAFSGRPIKSCFRSHRRAPSLHSVRQRFENGGVCVCPVPIVS
jgi:hypothetical protein